jgi:hypothetical protein
MKFSEKLIYLSFGDSVGLLLIHNAKKELAFSRKIRNLVLDENINFTIHFPSNRIQNTYLQSLVCNFTILVKNLDLLNDIPLAISRQN